MQTAGPRVSKFLELYCTHTKGRWAGQPVILEPWQDDFINEAFRVDDDGRRVYTTALLGVPRKNGKSTIAAGAGLYLLEFDGEPGPEVVIASGSRDQAGIVFDQARAYVEHSDELAAKIDPQRFILRRRGGEGFAKRIAADGKLQHGLNPSGVVFDELHAVLTPRQIELWAAMTTGSGARDQPLILAITTAGFDRESTLGLIYFGALSSPTAEIESRPGLTIVRDPANGFLMWWYGVTEELEETLDWNDEASWMPAVLAANPASWITAAYLRRQRNSVTLHLNDFKRLHANAWTSARESWLPSGLWRSLTLDGLTLRAGESVFVGVDVGLVHDSTAVTLAWLLESGDVAIKTKVWSTRQDTIAHEYVPGGRFDISIAEDFIRETNRTNPVRLVSYDPRFFEDAAVRLDRDGFVISPLEQSSATMSAAYQSFYQRARESRLHHDGDPILAAHIDATAAEMTERGWRIRKLRSHQKIDGTVASVIAHYHASRIDPNPYTHRGLIVL